MSETELRLIRTKITDTNNMANIEKDDDGWLTLLRTVKHKKITQRGKYIEVTNCNLLINSIHDNYHYHSGCLLDFM